MFAPLTNLQRWVTTIMHDDAKPETVAVRDKATLQRWLSGVPLIDTGEASQSLAKLLDELYYSELAGSSYLTVLDQLRAPVLFVQEQGARQFQGRPLPLGATAKQAFAGVALLWQQLASAYERVAAEAQNQRVPAQWPISRAIEALTGLAIVHYGARQALPPEYWRRLYALYVAANEHGALEAVNPGEADGPSVAHMVFFNALMHLADPYRLSTREFELTRRWAIRWARRIGVDGTADRALHHAFDPALDSAPALLVADRHPRAIVLRLDELAKNLVMRIAALKQGASAKLVGLGADVDTPEALTLLGKLYQRWSASPRPPEPPRGARARLQIDLLADAPRIIDRRTWDRASTASPGGSVYSYATPSHMRLNEAETRRNDASPGFNLPWQEGERWDEVRTTGSTLTLRRTACATRLAPGALVALRRAPQGEAFLGVIDRVLEETDGGIEASVTVWPGRAERVLVEADPRALAADHGRHRPAVLVVHPDGEQAHLVVAPNAAPATEPLRLVRDGNDCIADHARVAEHGTDFVRIALELAPLSVA